MTKWKLVPVEPTDEMQDAAAMALNLPSMYINGNPNGDGLRERQAGAAYDAMLAAAPKASEDEALVERVAMQLQQWDWSNNTVTAINRARAVLKMMEGSHEDRS